MIGLIYKELLKAYLYTLLLASLTVGGIYVALPAAYTLYKKGANLGVIFTYIGARRCSKDTNNSL